MFCQWNTVIIIENTLLQKYYTTTLQHYTGLSNTHAWHAMFKRFYCTEQFTAIHFLSLTCLVMFCPSVLFVAQKRLHQKGLQQKLHVLFYRILWSTWSTIFSCQNMQHRSNGRKQLLAKNDFAQFVLWNSQNTTYLLANSVMENRKTKTNLLMIEVYLIKNTFMIKSLYFVDYFARNVQILLFLYRAIWVNCKYRLLIITLPSWKHMEQVGI